MKVLIKQAKIYNSLSEYHLQTKDLLIEGGIIKKIGDSISETADKIVEAEGLSVSVGWFDPSVQFCDPGFEYNEDLKTGLESAMNGGFTAVGVLPNTLPVVDSKSQVEYLKNRTLNSLVDVYPIGALSEGTEGKNITEMYDMSLSGAIAFSDGQKSIQSPNLLKKALLYTQPFDGIVSVYSEDEDLAHGGHVNESPNTMNLGLKVRTDLAESIQVERNIQILKYTGGRLHLSGVSTKESIAAIKRAKAEGLNLTADASVNSVVYSDKVLQDFDTNFKVLPVLRDEENVNSLKQAVEEGVIDFISSQHTPLNVEYKVLEFDHASFGASTLDVMFSDLISSGLKVETIIKSLSENSRKSFGMEQLKLAENEVANLTLFSDSQKWVADNSSFKSKSKNTNSFGKELKGKVIGVINKGQVLIK